MLKMHPNTPFDLIFIDADKPGNLNYFPEAKRLVKFAKAALSYVMFLS
jgi:predicted O-methyltransferase YrrM